MRALAVDLWVNTRGEITTTDQMLVVAKDLQTRRNKASVAATFYFRMADSATSSSRS